MPNKGVCICETECVAVGGVDNAMLSSYASKSAVWTVLCEFQVLKIKVCLPVASARILSGSACSLLTVKPLVFVCKEDRPVLAKSQHRTLKSLKQSPSATHQFYASITLACALAMLGFL